MRKRPRKHKRKADLRVIKAAHAHCLPRFQYTIRCKSTGATFVSYASELSKTYATLAITHMLEHLEIHGVDLKHVVRTDLHPRILLLHPCFLDALMDQLLSVPPESESRTPLSINRWTSF
ncbi:MAG: hypothetical protein LBD01_04350 [Puniceicoccales bacterium]|nr:hypothetical protein [Puniceicoccales bacterium]